MRRSDPKQPFVGTYRLGLTNVELYGQKYDFGGEFYCAPDDKSLPRMKVSLRYKFWREVVAVVLHESFEFLAVQNNARFVPCGQYMPASDIYRFHFDHNTMSRIMEDQGQFLANCLPDLATVWKKHRQKP